MDQFKEVTVGVDRLYSIPSVSLHHQGTYQCEIYSGQHSIVRLYFYVTGNKVQWKLLSLITYILRGEYKVKVTNIMASVTWVWCHLYECAYTYSVVLLELLWCKCKVFCCLFFALFTEFKFSSMFSLSDPPGCDRPNGAAGDIWPVSAPRRAAAFCARCFSPLLPPHPPFAAAPHCLFNRFTAAAVPLSWVKLIFYLHNIIHELHTNVKTRCPHITAVLHMTGDRFSLAFYRQGSAPLIDTGAGTPCWGTDGGEDLGWCMCRQRKTFNVVWFSVECNVIASRKPVCDSFHHQRAGCSSLWTVPNETCGNHIYSQNNYF